MVIDKGENSTGPVYSDGLSVSLSFPLGTGQNTSYIRA
jgi:hypothetical protein